MVRLWEIWANRNCRRRKDPPSAAACPGWASAKGHSLFHPPVALGALALSLCRRGRGGTCPGTPKTGPGVLADGPVPALHLCIHPLIHSFPCARCRRRGDTAEIQADQPTLSMPGGIGARKIWEQPPRLSSEQAVDTVTWVGMPASGPYPLPSRPQWVPQIMEAFCTDRHRRAGVEGSWRLQCKRQSSGRSLDPVVAAEVQGFRGIWKHVEGGMFQTCRLRCQRDEAKGPPRSSR